MKPRSAKTQFLERLAAAEMSLATLTPKAGIDAMLVFYAEERAVGCDIDDDGDMLLFHWLASDLGDNTAIGFDITRQLMVTDDEDDEPRQLRLCFEFESVTTTGVGAGHHWCESPEGLDAFRKFIFGSAAFNAVNRKTPKLVELHFGRT